MKKKIKKISRKEAERKNLKRYFTNKPCLRGHLSERLVSSKGCIECYKIHEKNYYSKPRAKLKKRLRQKKYFLKNIDKVRERDRARSKTKKFKDVRKKYNQLDYVKDKRAKYNKEYREKNYLKLLLKDRAYAKNIKRKDKMYLLKENYRRRILLSLKSQNAKKDNSIVKLLGCSIKEYKNYLEKKFYDHPASGIKMTWRNHGLKGWHIDHRKPLIKFDLKKIKEQKKAFNYKNTQPMWAFENLKKGKNF